MADMLQTTISNRFSMKTNVWISNEITKPFCSWGCDWIIIGSSKPEGRTGDKLLLMLYFHVIPFDELGLRKIQPLQRSHLRSFPCLYNHRLVPCLYDCLLQSECRYNAIQFVTILHRTLPDNGKTNQALSPQKTSHTSPFRASYVMSVVRIWEEIDSVITATQYIRFNVSCIGYINSRCPAIFGAISLAILKNIVW